MRYVTNDKTNTHIFYTACKRSSVEECEHIYNENGENIDLEKGFFEALYSENVEVVKWILDKNLTITKNKYYIPIFCESLEIMEIAYKFCLVDETQIMKELSENYCNQIYYPESLIFLYDHLSDNFKDFLFNNQSSHSGCRELELHAYRYMKKNNIIMTDYFIRSLFTHYTNGNNINIVLEIFGDNKQLLKDVDIDNIIEKMETKIATYEDYLKKLS